METIKMPVVDSNRLQLVFYKKLYPDSKEPYKATAFSNGYDLYVHRVEVLEENPAVLKYYTGLAFQIPVGCVGLLFPRSSVCKYPLSMANSVAVIDSDYRGEVMAMFRVHKHELGNFYNKQYNVGERFVQLVIVQQPNILMVHSDMLTETVRGTGGVGSTGLQ